MRVSNKEYVAQLGGMLLNGRQWLDDHPGADIKIQWNYPSKVAVIQSISEAVEMKTVVANAQGIELLKALWRWDVDSEPTVLMSRHVIENLLVKR